jgi:hypothetical protein
MMTTTVVIMEFRDLTDEERAELQDQLRELAWAFARRAAGLGGTDPYRAARERAHGQRVANAADLSQPDRRRMHLGWLRMLSYMEAELMLAADVQAFQAASESANFRELGDAWGITRQGALKKWGRRFGERVAPDVGDRVRLTYGDGSGCEGTREDTPDGPALRLDDGTLHPHVTGQVRREVIERAEDF